MTTREDINNWFTYHAPNEKQKKAYENIRAAAKTLALTIQANVSPCDDQSAAFRKLRETVMTANAGIACAKELRESDVHTEEEWEAWAKFWVPKLDAAAHLGINVEEMMRRSKPKGDEG